MEKGKILVELQDHMGSDRAIANAAWTSSYDKEKRDARSAEDVARVVTMLIDLKHATPVEFVNFRFWIRMPIFIDRQWMTHRIQSASGLSARYRTLPDDWLHFPLDCFNIIEKAQGFEEAKKLQIEYNEQMQISYEWYDHRLFNLKHQEKKGNITNAEYKRLREILRGVVGTSSMVERTTSLNLRSFANVQKLRNDGHAQPEIRYVAQEMLQQVEEAGICPYALEALKKNQWSI